MLLVLLLLLLLLYVFLVIPSRRESSGNENVNRFRGNVVMADIEATDFEEMVYGREGVDLEGTDLEVLG